MGLSRSPAPPLAKAQAAARRSSATSRSRSKGTEGDPKISNSRARPGVTLFEKLRAQGNGRPGQGTVTLEGELARLTLSETLRRRIPREAVPTVKALALNSGVVDIELKRFRYDPTAAPGSRLSYQALARLREGVWECPKPAVPGQRPVGLDQRGGRYCLDQARPGVQRTDNPARRGNDGDWRPGPLAAGPAGRLDRPGARPAASQPDSRRVRRAVGRVQAPRAGERGRCT